MAFRFNQYGGYIAPAFIGEIMGKTVILIGILIVIVAIILRGFIIVFENDTIPINVLENRELVEKALKFNGVEKVNFDMINGYYFIRDGQVCDLFNYDFRVKYAEEIKEYEEMLQYDYESL